MKKEYEFTLAEVFSPHFASSRKTAFTLAEVFSPHFASSRKTAFTLAEVFSPHFASSRKTAFTLAEVLITLSIIGVVAAMTMPSIVSVGNDKAFVSKLQKVNSTLSQAHIEAERKYGLSEDWGFKDGSTSKVEMIYNYFEPYLNVSRDCGTDTGKGVGCFDPNWTTLNGAAPGWTKSKYGLGGNVKAFQLKDGTTISIDGHDQNSDKTTFGVENHVSKSNFPILMVDVNGKKNPNKIGRDIYFFIIGDDGIVPAGVDNNNDCNKSSRGYSCAGKVLKEKKINY